MNTDEKYFAERSSGGVATVSSSLPNAWITLQDIRLPCQIQQSQWHKFQVLGREVGNAYKYYPDQSLLKDPV